MAYTSLYRTPGSGAKPLSPLSPDNEIATELRSDPRATSDLLRDINRALASPLPTPADYVRHLEAELAASTATPRQLPPATGGGGGWSAAPAASQDQSAKDLVDSLERLLQQPAATPGRVAISALRRSQTGEAAAPAATSPDLGAGLGTGWRHGHSGDATPVVAPAGSGSPAATPTLLSGPASRWRLAAERAASFKTPAGSPGSAGAPRRQVSFASAARMLSPTEALLAQIDQSLSPAASPAASPSAAPAGAAATSPTLRATPSFAYRARDNGCHYQAASLPRALAIEPSSPSAVGAPYSPTLPGALWETPAPAGDGAAAGPGAAARLQQAGATSSAPSSVAASPAPAAAAAVPSATEHVSLPAAQFDLHPASSGFEREAALVLQELTGFPALERRSAAQLEARLGAELARLYALPPSQTAGSCC